MTDFDIIDMFPYANEFKGDDSSRYSLFLFEEELTSLLKVFATAKSRGGEAIIIPFVSKDVGDFLVERGYKIEENSETGEYKITW